MHSGGVERRRLSLAEKLDPKRFEQILICTEASPELKARFERAGCPVTAVGPMRSGLDRKPIAAAARALRAFAPDIVHGAVYEGVILAALAGRLARVPIIVGEETIYPVGRRWSGHLYYRLLAALTHRMVAISGAVADYLIGTLRVPRSRVRLIYNGVREPEPASADQVADIRKRFGLAPDALVVGTVGRLAAPRGLAPDSHKRIGDAILAMEGVVRECPNARLLIVGDGPDRAMLEGLAASRGLADAIAFAGFQPDMRPLFEAMDLLVHTAASEGLPLVIVEAMLAGLAVVAASVPGVTEVVEDGKTGYLVAPRAPEALAARSVELLGDPGLRARLGENGRRRARERFGEDRYVGEVAEFYEDLARELLPGRSR